ncbi:ATP-binding cassette domain-containing protein [Panacibacter ginsenosidivorans]|uniref:ATP-binding cassette domain-containing protein n=1 Tax=Panacibacter ginsenosidivorans TaxID=1813871 RepID=A0A5B8VA15_9BACT|nr:ATP-binding cassette domain-containing protein [Panacibacter ginsenosidivorans]QEC67773.1 ATP-binding cassette domain-containing protein [Panacibacter ginsenosidivorans]
MQLELKQIVPIPLKDKFSKRGSDIWNNNLHFSKGEWIKIKAPSGTGKTTFIHIIYKLRHDYEGTVLWSNNELTKIAGDDLAQLRQKNISVIFQDLRLFPNVTARENIELKRVLQTPFYEKNMIDAMAERLGVSHILDQRAGLCSYGEQQRIAIIRALIQPFDWLIMDEPFSHLDQENIGKAAALIAEECTKRKAGFMLTDLDEDSHFKYTKVLNL